ncbi:hypothetical protein [Deinococcus sp.]|uniref:hypothetical protein n=1 Tax=Deinococcus sp. TaxID=47478 RepID=UPI0025BC7928|nr:hypothetical protein [Deinococcus sp.]
MENSRPRFEPLIKTYLQESDLTEYQAALEGLLPHLPAQLRLQDDSTQHGFWDVENILALIAFAAGRQWAGMLLSQGALALTHEQAQITQTAYNRECQDAVVLPGVMQAAFYLGRDDLPQSLWAEHAAYQAHLERIRREPPEDLEF